MLEASKPRSPPTLLAPFDEEAALCKSPRPPGGTHSSPDLLELDSRPRYRTRSDANSQVPRSKTRLVPRASCHGSSKHRSDLGLRGLLQGSVPRPSQGGLASVWERAWTEVAEGCSALYIVPAATSYAAWLRVPVFPFLPAARFPRVRRSYPAVRDVSLPGRP